VSAFPSLWEGTPLTVFEALAMGNAIVATDADGLMDVLTADPDPGIVRERVGGRPPGRSRRGDRGETRSDGAGTRHPAPARSSGRAGAALGERAAQGAPVRYRDVRPKDGAPLRTPAPGVAIDEAPRRAPGRSHLPDR